MKTVTINGHEFDFDAVVNLMDDDLRLALHNDWDDTSHDSEQRFVTEYRRLHREKFGADFIVN